MNYPLFITSEESKKIFSIDKDGNIEYIQDGVMTKVTDQQSLALALAAALKQTVTINEELQKKVDN